jgi:PiT family inorganic phosphate transporter
VITYVVVIVAIAFTFDFINGFHDSANSIATVVGTRVLSPVAAVGWAALFNFLAAFTVGTAVAKTIGVGMIDVSIVTPSVILGALMGAIAWNLITWWFGLPSSSSHALLGGYAGAAIAKAGFGSIIVAGWTKTIAFIFISPVVGLMLGFGLMVLNFWVFQRVSPGRVDRLFRHGQLASSALFSYSHGANDAQKTMGIITGLLVATQGHFATQSGMLRHLYVPSADHIPTWVELTAYTTIALGTLVGGWRIIHTMGSRITRLKPVSGFSAETGGALSILLATVFGIPVSTTHTISGAIVGAGMVHRVRAVRWGVAGRIIWAWIFTIPAAAVMAAVCYWLLAFVIQP